MALTALAYGDCNTSRGVVGHRLPYLSRAPSPRFSRRISSSRICA